MPSKEAGAVVALTVLIIVAVVVSIVGLVNLVFGSAGWVKTLNGLTLPPMGLFSILILMGVPFAKDWLGKQLRVAKEYVAKRWAVWTINIGMPLSCIAVWIGVAMGFEVLGFTGLWSLLGWFIIGPLAAIGFATLNLWASAHLQKRYPNARFWKIGQKM